MCRRNYAVYLLVMYLMLPLSSADALVFNRVSISGSDVLRVSTQEAMLADRLFYVDGEKVLHVTDGTSQGSRALLDNIANPNFPDSEIAVFGDKLFAIRAATVRENGELRDFEVWETDGTVANTRKALNIDLPFFQNTQAIKAVGNRLFITATQRDDLTLAISDGTQAGTVVLNTGFPDLESICVVGDSFYFSDLSSPTSSPVGRFIQFKDGLLEAVDLDLSNFSIIRSTPPVQFDDVCIYQVSTDINGGVRQLVAFDEAGRQTFYTLPSEFGSITAPFILTDLVQDKLLLSRGYSFAGLIRRIGGLFELQVDDEDLIQLTLDSPSAGSRITSIQAGNDGLYVFFGPPSLGSPAFNSLGIYDSDFNLLGGMNIGFDDLRVLALNGLDLLYEPHNRVIKRIEDGMLVDLLRPYDMALERIIFNRKQDNATIFAIGNDRQNNLSALYQLSPQPTVSERLVGLWGNPAFNRTGVQINTALGGDRRTRFLFLALLAHESGSPIWLSGAAPIIDGSRQISLTMRMVDGLPFLVPDENLDGQRIEIGTAELTVMGCNQIRVQFDLDEPFGAHDVVFDRLVDIAFDPLCNDA